MISELVTNKNNNELLFDSCYVTLYVIESKAYYCCK